MRNFEGVVFIGTKSFKKITIKLHGDRINDVNDEMVNEKVGSLKSYYSIEKKQREGLQK